MFSKSLFIKQNNKKCVFKSPDGKVLTGTVIIPAEESPSGAEIIIRLNDFGLLNSENMPAVETVGHIEFWKNGSLHRDNHLPAVCAAGFKIKEYWENGKKL